MDGCAVSVVIASHDPRRLDYLCATAASAAAQSLRPAKVVVVVDHHDELLKMARARLPMITVLANQHPTGASGTRNTGAAEVTTPLVAFLDDDMVPAPDWLARLTEPLADPGVVGTGGAIRPLWVRQPAWVPDEFLWAYGASFAGMPTTTTQVRNVWSASMAVRRDLFEAVGGFRLGFGKTGDRSRPEDTELCLRMADYAGGHWLYVPSARAGHRVPRENSTIPYFLTRCFNEGRGKIELARLFPRGDEPLSTERAYLRGLPGALTSRVAQAGAIVAGLAAAGVGAAVELAVSYGAIPVPGTRGR